MPGPYASSQLVAAGLKLTSGVSSPMNTAGWPSLTAVVTMVTSSGTVASFGAWLEGSNDGNNWFPVPMDIVLQARPTGSTGTNWVPFGSGGVASVNSTTGFFPIMLVNQAANVTSSQCWVGMKRGGLPSNVRANYAVMTVDGALNFFIDATVSS
jgi:hypothetical protein